MMNTRRWCPKRKADAAFRVTVVSFLDLPARTDEDACKKVRRMIENSSMGFGSVMGELSRNLQRDKLSARRRCNTGVRAKRGAKYA
jgi:hypothetical protein